MVASPTPTTSAPDPTWQTDPSLDLPVLRTVTRTQVVGRYALLWLVMIVLIALTIAGLFGLSIFIDGHLQERNMVAVINPHTGDVYLPQRNTQIETFVLVGIMVSATYLARFQLEDVHRTLRARIVHKVK